MVGCFEHCAESSGSMQCHITLTGLAGYEEGQYCMEFRGTALLNVMNLSSRYATEVSGLYSLQGQKYFTAKYQDSV